MLEISKRWGHIHKIWFFLCCIFWRLTTKQCIIASYTCVGRYVCRRAKTNFNAYHFYLAYENLRKQERKTMCQKLFLLSSQHVVFKIDIFRPTKSKQVSTSSACRNVRISNFILYECRKSLYFRLHGQVY